MRAPSSPVPLPPGPRSRPSVALLRACALVMVATFGAGCIFQQGGPDDLGIVCEVKSGSPGPAYSTDGLVAMTRVDASTPTPLARQILDALRPHVLTVGRHAHAQLSANLTRTGNASWTFTAEGRDAAGALVDDYNLTVDQSDAGIAVTPTRPALAPIVASPAMIREAMAVVNNTVELRGIPTRTPTMVATGWDPSIPSCVRLLYQDGPSDAIVPASDEHPQTTVVVSLVSDRVVLLKRDHWTDVGTSP